MKRLQAYLIPALTIFMMPSMLTSCGDSDPENNSEEPEAPFYVADKELTFEAVGGYQLLYVTSSNVSWIVDCEADWITAAPKSSASTEAVRVDVAPNPDSIPRSDTLWVRSTSFSWPKDYAVKITQKGIK